MPIFKKRNNSLYLLTNYKVMYSTLKHQKNIERLVISNKTKYTIILNQWLAKDLKFYLIVRNPYDKIESFFKDKFRQSLNHDENNCVWQASQEIFFPYLDIEESMSPETIKNKFKDTSFSNMIAILPEVYLLDGHLQPQYKEANLVIILWKFTIQVPIRIKKVFKLESLKDLNMLNKIFGIDTNIKVNITSEVREELMWTKQDLQIVNKLYRKDFKRFKYLKKSL